MAKKARKKPEEEESFEFPVFDEPGFLAHEFEQYYATMIAFVLGLVIGGASYAISGVAGSPWGGFGVGIAAIVGSVFAIRSIRPRSREYTKGDWAALIVLMFFAFLGVWFLLADLFGPTLV